ncbi:MAG: GNAT family N-acetyltransferase [Clostridia bacterium]|nr:GNAT family N-acetyltransferase [Clostridia bacterium]
MSELILESINDNHIESAARLALSEYFEECCAVPILPEADYLELFCKMITELADPDLGTVAIESGKVVGFLTCYQPWENHFGTTLGTFSPVHAHGTVKQNRRRIYSQLYQAAAEKWVSRGILSHAIALYAHNHEAVDSFFWNGFGMRTVDAIRPVEPILCEGFSNAAFYELPDEEIDRIVPLKNSLIAHLRDTPMFIPLFFQMDTSKVKVENESRKSRYFVATVKDEIAAFVEIMASGENFTCQDTGMANICGAYMFPQYRGSGIYTKLLSFLMETLAAEGYTRCGVDFESFNPTARGFWLKYFSAYTYGVVRRVDERILKHT